MGGCRWPLLEHGELKPASLVIEALDRRIEITIDQGCRRSPAFSQVAGGQCLLDITAGLFQLFDLAVETLFDFHGQPACVTGQALGALDEGLHLVEQRLAAGNGGAHGAWHGVCRWRARALVLHPHPRFLFMKQGNHFAGQRLLHLHQGSGFAT